MAVSVFFAGFYLLRKNVVEEIKLATQLPRWSLALIAVFFVVWIYGCYRYESSSRKSKIFLGTLRLLIVAGLLLILSEPVLEITRGEIDNSSVIILCDSSESMTTKDEYQDEQDKKAIQKIMNLPEGASKVERLALMKRLINDSETLQKIDKECDLHIYSFGGDKQLKKLSSTPSLEAKSESTVIYDNFVHAVENTLKELKSKNITGIFLLTDGQQNQGKRSWIQAADYARIKRIPVYPVGLGAYVDNKDIIVSKVKGEHLVLAGDRVEFKVEIRNKGFQGKPVRLFIKDGDIPLTDKSIVLGKDGKPQEVKIVYTFKGSGNQPKFRRLSFTIPKQEGEAREKNNSSYHTLVVYPKKFRVLYLEGSPRWEYRYLKNALIRDPNITANMWLFSADERFLQDKSEDAKSIYRLPRDEKIFEYDCIIIGDVSVEEMGVGLQENLEKFVKEKGGGVVFVSGNLHNPSTYWNTPLGELLPISSDITKKIANKAYNITLTEMGKRHNIMRLVDDVKENQKIWENKLEKFYWYFPVSSVKRGATVLAEIKADPEKEDSAFLPLMVARMYGKGQVFFTGTDSSWRWRYLKGDVYFDRFWGQVIRHISLAKLVGVGDQKKYFLKVDNHQCNVGEFVEIELEILNLKENEDESKDSQTIYYQRIFKDKNNNNRTGRKGKITLHYDSNSGTYKESFRPKKSGTYKIWYKTEYQEEVSDIFHAEAPKAEMEKISLNQDDLENMAKKTKGKLLKPHELEEFWKENFVRLTKKHSSNEYNEEKPAWNYYWIFILLVGLFTLEWIMRKMIQLL